MTHLLPKTPALIAVAALLLGACSAPPPPTEGSLLQSATLAFEEGSYTVAVEDYDTLLTQFPFSDHAERASFNIAHAYYLNGRYSEAVSSFRDFERLYPVSPLLPYAEYLIGLSELNQANDGERDPSGSEEALRHFERLRQRYPDSIYARLATFRIGQCQENLAEHELHVGDFYMAAGKPKPARARYGKVLEKYPHTSVAKEVRQRIARLADEAAENVVPLVID